MRPHHSNIFCLPLLNPSLALVSGLVTALRALRRSSALFGLIDDVDCAVISMEIAKNLACPVRLQHVASIPALAYVATGGPTSVRCLLL